MSSIGEKIKMLREAKGQSQTEFANNLGLGRGTLVKMEAGTQRVYWDVIVSIATYCNVSLDGLAGIESESSIREEIDYLELNSLIEAIGKEENAKKRESQVLHLKRLFTELKSEISILKKELLQSLRKLQRLI